MARVFCTLCSLLAYKDCGVLVCRLPAVRCYGTCWLKAFSQIPSPPPQPPVGDPVGCSITHGWLVAALERHSPAQTLGRADGWEVSGAGFRLPDGLDSSRVLLPGDISTEAHRGIAHGKGALLERRRWVLAAACRHGCECSPGPCRAARRTACSPVPSPTAAMSPSCFFLLHLGKFRCCSGLLQSQRQQGRWISLGRTLERLIYLCMLFLGMPFHCY